MSADIVKNMSNEDLLLEYLEVSKQISEDNFFAIGTRGYYENPFTQVLSYILKQKTKYKYREQFIRSLFKNIIPSKVIESFIKSSTITTQYSTTRGNYIDLLIYNDNFIIVFENKIHHWLANPFEDYESDIKKRFPGLKIYFILFSYRNETAPINWIYVNIISSFNKIKQDIDHKFEDKWDYFVLDFLDHYTNSKRITMEEEEKEFYKENFSKIIDLNNSLNQFFKSIGENIKKETNSSRFKLDLKWNKINRALRFYPTENEDNVTLIFTPDGDYSISIYFYKNYTTHLENLINIIGHDGYENWQESNVTCFTRLPGREYKTLSSASIECIDQINKMINYYG